MLPVVMLVFGVVMFAVAIASLRSWHRAQEGPPRERKRHQKWTLLIFSLLIVQNIYLMVSLGGQGKTNLMPFYLFNVGVMGVAVLATLYTLPRPPSEAEARVNFQANPNICGRCDYDLTGNSSGVCPECGWIISRDSVPLDAPNWHAWWRGWKIASLENWRRTLRNNIGFLVTFAVIGIVMYWAIGVWQSAIMLMLVAGHFAINTIRVIQYGRRQSRG